MTDQSHDVLVRSKGDLLREKLFALGVESVQTVFGIEDEIYICPICGVGFTREHLESKYLTLEHAPPESQGGKKICLTCFNCNSTAGETIDAEAYHRERSYAFYRAIAGQNDHYKDQVYLIVRGRKITVNFEAKKEKYDVQILEKINDPAITNIISEALPSIWNEGSEIKFQEKRGYRKRWAQVSDLRSAYLLAFAALGYTYAFNSRLDPIREQIESYKENIIEGFWWNFKHMDPKEKEIAIATEPISFVYVKLPRSVIFLPGLKETPNFYGTLKEEISKGERSGASGVKLEWPTKLVMSLDKLTSQNR